MENSSWGLGCSIGDDAREFGIRANLSVDFCFTAHALNARAGPQRRHFQHQGIAGHHRATKARFLYAGKEHQLLIAIFDFTQRQDRAALRERFNYQNARHYRRARKVALKILFVDADLLDPDNARAGYEFDDSIDEQKRIAVREEFFYSFRVENGLHGCSISFIASGRRGEINSWPASTAAFAGLGPLSRLLSHVFQKGLTALAFCLNH